MVVKMKLIRKCPVFILLVGTGILFTIMGIVGRKNVYADQKYDPLTTPILSVMFTAMNDDIYPWHLFMGKSSQVMAQGKIPDKEPESAALEGGEQLPDKQETAPETSTDELQAPEESLIAEEQEKQEDNAPRERIEPLRESTYEEYLNHISADIYGDAGVKRAAEYEFSAVDESYFDDALFIGDSRTVGLRNYTDLSDYADFYCETSLTIYKIFEEDFEGRGSIEEALESKDYGKIYIMVGINELGVGTTEDFLEEYTKVIDRLCQLEPEAKIFIQGIMRVSGEKSNSDAIFNNSNIDARNHAIATLADNEQIFYIDVNEVVCDEEGNLIADYTFDQIHLLGVYDDLWKQFLLAHGVK